MDSLHEEISLSISQSTSTRPGSDPIESTSSDESNWTEVGRKKLAITRSVELKASPITTIFGGHFRSVLRRPGNRDSVVIEPFHSLQLDISVYNFKRLYDD